MARRGFGGTALRAALGAVEGVTDALQQREVLKREQERQSEALARQKRLDQLDLEEKTASLLSSGFMPEEEVAARKAAALSNVQSSIGNALASVRGGTMVPMSAEGMKRTEEGALGYSLGRKTSFGGKTYVLPETREERTERSKRTEAMLEQQKAEGERRRLTALAKAAKAGGRDSEAFAELAITDPRAAESLIPTPRQTDLGDALRMQAYQDEQKQARLAAKAWFNTPMPMPEYDKALTIYRNLKKRNPGASDDDIILAAYQSYAAGVEREATSALGQQRAAAAAKTGRQSGRAPSTLPPGATSPLAPPAKPQAQAPSPVDPNADLNSAFDQFTKR